MASFLISLAFLAVFGALLFACARWLEGEDVSARRIIQRRLRGPRHE